MSANFAKRFAVVALVSFALSGCAQPIERTPAEAINAVQQSRDLFAEVCVGALPSLAQAGTALDAVGKRERPPLFYDLSENIIAGDIKPGVTMKVYYVAGTKTPNACEIYTADVSRADFETALVGALEAGGYSLSAASPIPDQGTRTNGVERTLTGAGATLTVLDSTIGRGDRVSLARIDVQ